MSSSSTTPPAFPNGDNHSTEEATATAVAERAAAADDDEGEPFFYHSGERQELIYRLENHPTTFIIDDSISLCMSVFVPIILERCDLLMQYLTQSGRSIRSIRLCDDYESDGVHQEMLQRIASSQPMSTKLMNIIEQYVTNLNKVTIQGRVRSSDLQWVSQLVLRNPNFNTSSIESLTIRDHRSRRS